ncbi:MAG: hypothetical protein HFG89_00320 [Dorea sp.]|jgi:hypothetical protein|nr:hypothetical protein [Dorea sp.]
MENRKINILGTEYKVGIGYDSDEADGEARFYKKEINLRPVQDMLDDDSSDSEKENRFLEVFRHEVLHSILYEAGADEYARDENLIGLLAILSPRIFKVFQELDIL